MIWEPPKPIWPSANVNSVVLGSPSPARPTMDPTKLTTCVKSGGLAPLRNSAASGMLNGAQLPLVSETWMRCRPSLLPFPATV